MEWLIFSIPLIKTIKHMQRVVETGPEFDFYVRERYNSYCYEPTLTPRVHYHNQNVEQGKDRIELINQVSKYHQ